MKGRKHREAGGRTPHNKEPEKISGLREEFAEARKKKHGGKITDMHGAKAKHRLDRPGRKTGGRVGANLSPLSTAHKGTSGHEARD